MNLLAGQVVGGSITVAGRNLARDVGQMGPVTVCIRLDDLRVAEGPGRFEGRVMLLEPLGAETLVYADIGGQEVVARADDCNPPAVGAVVQLHVALENLHLFNGDGKAVK